MLIINIAKIDISLIVPSFEIEEKRPKKTVAIMTDVA